MALPLCLNSRFVKRQSSPSCAKSRSPNIRDAPCHPRLPASLCGVCCLLRAWGPGRCSPQGGPGVAGTLGFVFSQWVAMDSDHTTAHPVEGGQRLFKNNVFPSTAVFSFLKILASQSVCPSVKVHPAPSPRLLCS